MKLLFLAVVYLVFSRVKFGEVIRQTMTYENERRDREWSSFRGQLCSSFLITASIGVICATYGFYVEFLSIHWAIDSIKAINYTGTLLTVWSTLFALGNKHETWGGKSIIDNLSPLLFKVIFVPGITLMLITSIS